MWQSVRLGRYISQGEADTDTGLFCQSPNFASDRPSMVNLRDVHGRRDTFVYEKPQMLSYTDDLTSLAHSQCFTSQYTHTNKPMSGDLRDTTEHTRRISGLGFRAERTQAADVNLVIFHLNSERISVEDSESIILPFARGKLECSLEFAATDGGDHRSDSAV